jgi:ribonuclease HIII
VGFDLPKGAAAQVDAAGRRVVKQYGVQKLREVAKVHFKNYRRATDPQLFA